MSNAPVIGHYINGQVHDSASERFSNVFNPATGEVQARVGLASQKTVDEAVASALKAFPAWSEQSSLRRSRVLFKFKELLDQHHDELAEIISREHGKVFSDAKGEVTRGIEIVEFACGAPNLLKTDFSDNIGGGIDNWNLRQPLGVCAGITPFNFPVMVPLWMIPLALATGNCFILKPSERDPSASLLMARLLTEAGLPDGVFNVVQGDKSAVDGLLQHPDIEAISFVGSTPIAEYIHQQATQRGKRVQALGGAKNHMIVMPDADLDQAADALIGAAYGSAGERCMAISIAVVVGDVGDRLIEKLLPRIDQLKVGNGMQKDSEMGPLVTAEHKAKVEGFIDQGVAQGAKLIVDGRGFKVPGAEGGFFVGATLFDNVTTEMSIYQQEIFGPVLGIVRVADFASAVALINAHEFGNGVSCFTSDGGIARAFARTIKVGMVGINVPIPVPMAWHSFGGWKRSLFGDHHAYGEEGIRFYSRYKSVMQRWPDSIAKGPEFSMPTAK
ncbi:MULTISPECIES: CoA-acylating methylmalonate-semialdehyde dehydrogenase [unclassified Pseudomonas]|jgi:malonate-semialdehyde dehydrogenase (acetylating)/methylmalonate-semialdehyde dehydrogenase|uniref:CoA-acylating methylmalonate-semialdehyde dehydrogenase n=1 Tax=unclassified Pseudomonas TaxID=196821 RepID=UPI000C86B788|nr:MULTISPECIES: CoA-acylating methylmalonate-semialdehyde dehydrogenase [unclassified Pseudomonas]MDQ0668776.1 malonate-semialdehyde dehydrogenase (acetylating)/methylmalonate-semialdehyde dehydrogenase [Pseudomonas sp. W2I6]NVZ41300.1 CoA-acylating methylmalonate-semialdehyde dehydrogenase [Pseudomonas sp. 21615526]NWA35105.1 CoA-acylating methylmalonate-semialdehyde dehydrogenase [Pseudomonas sp. C6002]NWA89292.1 CoA-acylating methylmalonate-semialdehyde dehydrogenase [Pseudomonas sp. D8002]